MKPLHAVAAVLGIAALLFFFMWYRGRERSQQEIFERAAQMAEDTAAKYRPLIDAQKARADSAEAALRIARQEMQVFIEAADSVERERRIIIESIDTVEVPEDVRKYTDPLRELISSYQAEVVQVREALSAATRSLAAADVALASQDSVIAHLETSLSLALEALDQRPSNRWYIPKVQVGYGAMLSRRDWEIHDGPSVTVGWTIGF